MIGRVAALLIWIACYYYDLWNLIPETDHVVLVFGLIILFFLGDEPIITYKKIVKVYRGKKEEEDDE